MRCRRNDSEKPSFTAYPYTSDSFDRAFRKCRLSTLRGRIGHPFDLVCVTAATSDLVSLCMPRSVLGVDRVPERRST